MKRKYLVIGYTLAAFFLTEVTCSPVATQATAAERKSRSRKRKRKAIDPFKKPEGGWPEDAPKGIQKGVKVEGLEEMPAAFYHLAVPQEYTPENEYPLFIVLHGGPGGNPDSLLHVLGKPLLERGAVAVYPQALRNQLLEWNYPQEAAYMILIIRQLGKT